MHTSEYPRTFRTAWGYIALLLVMIAITGYLSYNIISSTLRHEPLLLRDGTVAPTYLAILSLLANFVVFGICLGTVAGAIKSCVEIGPDGVKIIGHRRPVITVAWSEIAALVQLQSERSTTTYFLMTDNQAFRLDPTLRNYGGLLQEIRNHVPELTERKVDSDPTKILKN